MDMKPSDRGAQADGPAAQSDAPTNTAGPLRIEAVSEWIAGLGVGACLPLTFTRVGGGQSNLTFLVVDAVGRRWILRRPPLGDLLASAHDVAREHRILEALQSTDVPTPMVHGLCVDPNVTDVPLLLMDYVDGVVVKSVSIGEQLSLECRRTIGVSLAGALGQIHAVDLDATGLSGIASRKPYAERQLRRWRRQWQDSRTRDLPIVDQLADRLAASVPEQREVTLVHGDFHLLNVIVGPEDGEVRAVLDWELCTLGDPIADLGGLLAYWPEAGEVAIPGFDGVRLPGFPGRRELAAAYGAATGRDLGSLSFWHVFALWKISVIAEGVMRRAQDNPPNGSAVATIDAGLVDALLARAVREAEAAGM